MSAPPVRCACDHDATEHRRAGGPCVYCDCRGFAPAPAPLAHDPHAFEPVGAIVPRVLSRLLDTEGDR